VLFFLILLFLYNQIFAASQGGLVPALLILVLKQCADPTTGAIKQTAFIAKLKETLKAGGWGFTLLDTMIQDTREEYVVVAWLLYCECESNLSTMPVLNDITPDAV
jgi:hypothetical protein